MGGVYGALDRVGAKGLVTSRFCEPTAVRGGKRKRYYQLTAEGREALHRSWQSMRAMARGAAPKLEQR